MSGGAMSGGAEAERAMRWQQARGLYAIVDPEACRGRDPLEVSDAILAGGCAALQLRAKRMPDGELLRLARAMAARAAERGVLFVVDDRVDLALLCGADGVHVGQLDLGLADVRALAPQLSVGLSTHDQAQVEAGGGADYLGFGPVFATRSKENPDPVVGLEGLARAVAGSPLPMVAIGGVDLARAPRVRETGVAMGAVISAICGADDPRAAAAALHVALGGAR